MVVRIKLLDLDELVLHLRVIHCRQVLLSRPNWRLSLGLEVVLRRRVLTHAAEHLVVVQVLRLDENRKAVRGRVLFALVGLLVLDTRQ